MKTADSPGTTQPSVHEQALMVWIAVLPTLTLLQLALGHLLAKLPQLARPPIMATLAVPVVVYILMPLFQRLRSGSRAFRSAR